MWGGRAGAWGPETAGQRRDGRSTLGEAIGRGTKLREVSREQEGVATATCLEGSHLPLHPAE